MADRHQSRLRQTPKHLERMLFVNHKEEQNLQRRLEAIATSGRARSRELDRERIKMRNVWRYNSRLNHTHIAPLLEQIPSLIKKEVQRPSDSIDPVNMHLLREYRKNGQIIPSILSALTKDSQQHDSTEDNEQAKVLHNNGANIEKHSQKSTRQRLYGLHSLNGSISRHKRKRQFDENDALSGVSFSDEDEDHPDPSKVTQLVRDITKLRKDMSANKKIESRRSKSSFQDLLRVVNAQEKRDSESATYTDGTCALLRRKMVKLRNPEDYDSAVEVMLDTSKLEFTVKHLLPKIDQKRSSMSQSIIQPKKQVLPATRSFNSVPTISR
ncbi:hypothetical protein ElyMa_002257700 [Elysia marginata]|uniref:BESS domain-containing protein n=1 Tax=Elysia marginata TaxID=1093978 RepID=A0AAV4FY93_9GAST|nr:hypothetical protein ElyMa_002257700 [Elysia marginata]